MDLPVQTTATPPTRPTLDLARIVVGAPPSYMHGRTYIRDTVARLLGCSALEAEHRVDRFERTGLIYFRRDPQPSLPDRGRWYARTGPL